MVELNDIIGAQFEDEDGVRWEAVSANAGGEPKVVLEGQNKGVVGMTRSKSLRMLYGELKSGEYEVVADPNGVLLEDD